MSRIDGQGHHPARVARGEKTTRFDRDTDLVEQLGAAWAACRGMHEYGVGREQRREHHNIAEKKDPEPVGNDDPLWRGTGFAFNNQRLLGLTAMDGHSDAHGATSAWCARSNCTSRPGGISICSLSRNANASIVRKAPKAPRMTIHQM